MKKKIAFVFNRMMVGGAEKALLNLLDAFDMDRYQVTLFTYDRTSVGLDALPPEVSIVYTKCTSTAQLLIDDLKRLRFLSVLIGLYYRIMARISKDEYKRFSYNIRCLPRFEGHYDRVIAFKLNYEDTATALWRFDATKRFVVAHSKVGAPEEQRSCYIDTVSKQFDRIFCVSEDLANEVRRLCGHCYDKVQVLHNILSVRKIQAQADEPLPFRLQRPAIVTVGRLSEEKGQALIPLAVRRLLDDGHNVYWYLVGDGPLADEVRHQIEVNDVFGHVVLLGMQQNPYPYMKDCDIYVQTSLSEGWCLTTQEAKILCKPIITTDLPVMHEQFVHNENGLITDGISADALVHCIKSLLDDPARRQSLVNTLRTQASESNENELNLLFDLLDD